MSYRILIPGRIYTERAWEMWKWCEEHGFAYRFAPTRRETNGEPVRGCDKVYEFANLSHAIYFKLRWYY